MRRLVLDLAATSQNWALTPEAERAIRAEAPPDWEVSTVTTPTSSDGDGGGEVSQEALHLIADAEVYVGFGITRPLFAAAPRLRWIHSAAAGVRGVLFPELRESDVLLTNSAGIHGVPIAETVAAGVLHFLRGLDIALEQQRAGVWDKRRFVALDSPLRELGDCRVLVVGAGGLGSEIAVRLAAFGATCVGLRRRPELGAPPGFAEVHGPDRLDAELPRADVLVLAAPQTERTSSLMDSARLQLLPPRAILVNVARGALLDEEALAAMLVGGRLRGAVLDVFREEPLPATSPFWGLPSALVIPHVSPVSPGRFWPRQQALILDNWRRYRSGAPLRNLVDKQQGY